MSLRSLFSVLLAVAMLFAPVGLFGGAAMAMAPGSHHQAAEMERGHCDEQPAPAEDNQPDEQPCCAAMCTAIAVSPAGPSGQLAAPASLLRPSPPSANHGFLAKLPTPPPRFV